MESLDSFAYIWNGSDPGWTVVRHIENREELNIVFGPAGATLEEVKALRLIDPTLRGKSAIDSWSAIKNTRSYSLGEHESSGARSLKTRCQSMMLQVESKGFQRINYSLLNNTTKRYLLIEDAEMCKAVAEEAVKNGVPLMQSII